ncbi:MAG: PAS domain S-box protein [Methylotetracoccus sp.]
MSHGSTSSDRGGPWLFGGGDMGRRIRTFDWSRTSLGPIAQWPTHLKVTVGICLESSHPAVLYWGPDLLQLYNDAFAPILGDKHPYALGRSTREVHANIPEPFGTLLDNVAANGVAASCNDQLVLGLLEERYFSYSLSPVRDESGAVAGVFMALTETTDRCIGERRFKVLRDLGLRASGDATGTRQVCKDAAKLLTRNDRGLTFALIYLLDDDGKHASLIEAVGIAADAPATPLRVTIGDEGDVWDFAAVLADTKLAVRRDLSGILGPLPAGARVEEATRDALVVPLANAGMRAFPAGFLVAGTSPRLVLDDSYRDFLLLVAGQIANAIANARGCEQEHDHAGALADLTPPESLSDRRIDPPARRFSARGLLARVQRHLDAARLREQSEEAIRESRARLQAAFASITEAVFIADAEGSLIEFNEEFIRYHRFRDRDECSRNIAECPRYLDVWLPDGRPAPPELWAMPRALRGEKASNVEFRLRRKDTGEEWWGSYNFAPITNRNGNIIGAVVTGREITEQKQIEAALRQSEARLRLAQESARIGIWDWHLDSGRIEWTPQLEEIFGYEPGDFGGDYSGFTDRVHPCDLAEIERIRDAAIAAHQAFTVDFRVRLPSGEIRWLNCRGAATYDTSGRAERVFGVSVDVTARMRAETVLRESEARLQVTVESLAEAVIVSDPLGNVLHWNRSGIAMFGYETPEQGQMPLDRFAETFEVTELDGTVLPLDQWPLSRILRGEQLRECELRVRRRSKDWHRIFSFSGNLVLDQDQRALLAVVSVNDITKRTLAEQALRDSEAKYRQLFDNMTEGFGLHEIILDSDGKPCDWRFVEMNAAWEAQTGVSRAVAIGKTMREVWPETDDYWLETFGRVALTGEPIRYENYSTPLRRWYETSAFSTKPNFFAVLFIDITPRKQAEMALRDSEMRLKLAASVADIGVFDWNLETGVNTWTPEMEALYGLQPGGFGRTQPAWEQLVHPADRAGAVAKNNETLATGKPVEHEFRIVWPDGSVHWIAARLQGFKDDTGKPFRLTGVNTDITARKQVEEHLRSSEARYRLLHEGMRDAFVQVDMDGRILDCNELFCQLVGYGRSELESMTYVDLTPSEWHAMESAIIETQILPRGYSEVYEKGYRRQDGTIVPIELRTILIRNTDGQPESMWATVRDITERKRAQEALFTANQQLEAVLEALPVGVAIIGADGERLRDNRAFQRVWGEPCPPVNSVDDYQAYRGWWVHSGQPVHPEEWASTQAVRQGKTVVGQLVEIARFDGTRAVIHNSAAPILDESGRIVGSAVAIMDVSAQFKTEAALLESESRFGEFMQRLPGLAWIKDSDGRYVYINEAAEHAFGQSPAACYGKTDEEIFPADTAAQFRENDRRALDTETGVVVIETLRHGDEVLHYSIVSKFPIRDFKGQIKGTGGVAIDITERVQAEQQLQEATERLREADRRKDEFLATLAHELRNPLAPIRSALQVFRKTLAPDPTTERLLDMMNRQMIHLVRLVDDLLEVSRITRGQIELRKESVDVAMLIKHAIDTSQPLIDAGQHAVKVSLPPEPLWIEGDPVRLTQVFANLINNAAKYTKSHGTIRVGAERIGDQIVVTVSDTGVGIAPEVLPRVFDLFTQADRDMTLSQGGLGIGLALVRHLVEMHRGTVTAHSGGPGHGSEFVVHLPIRAEPSTARTRSESTEGSTLPTTGRILVVDDNRDAADSLRDLLILEGFETRVAYDAEEGIKIAVIFRPDVVLLDLGMPRMDGYEACSLLRRQAWDRNLNVVALTGWGQEEDRRKAREAGFDAHLVKPVDHVALIGLITELMAAGEHLSARF